MEKFTISAFKHETIEKEIEAKTIKEAVDNSKSIVSTAPATKSETPSKKM